MSIKVETSEATKLQTSGLTTLGNKVTSEDTQGKLEVFPLDPKKSSRLTTVTLVTDEIFANCPLTSQPDFYSLELMYSPYDCCVESKAFKLYIHTLKDSGIFGEELARKIADDLMDATNAYWVNAKLTQRPRGGISIVSVAELQNPVHYGVGSDTSPVDDGDSND